MLNYLHAIFMKNDLGYRNLTEDQGEEVMRTGSKMTITDEEENLEVHKSGVATLQAGMTS